MSRNGFLHFGVKQTWLHDGGPGDRIDGDLAHLLRREHDPAVDRRRPTGESGARAAGHHWHEVSAGPAQHGLNLLG